MKRYLTLVCLLAVSSAVLALSPPPPSPQVNTQQSRRAQAIQKATPVAPAIEAQAPAPMEAPGAFAPPAEGKTRGIITRSNTIASKAIKSPLAGEDIPASLKDWVRWVKANDKKCPLTVAPGAVNCVYPYNLTITENGDSYKFKMSVYSYGENFITLPYGDSGSWPTEVKLNNQPAIMTEEQNFSSPRTDGAPVVVIRPGESTIEGLLKKENSYFLPAELAVFNNETKNNFNQSNNKISNQEIVKTSQKEVFSQKVYRKLSNQVPYSLMTQIILTYSGEEKDYNLGKVLPEGFELTSFNSSLSIQKADEFIVRLTNGEHKIILNAISKAKINKINIKGLINNHNEEYWSVENNQKNIFLNFSNLTSIDPNRLTPVPAWASLGVWKAGDEITLKEEKTENKKFSMDLFRSIWLDDENDKWLTLDKIKIFNPDREKFYLPKQFKVEEVKLDGARRLILKDQQGSYVFIGGGNHELEIFMNQPEQMSIGFGYQDDLNSASTNFTLPPRWRLSAVTGAGSAPGSWLDGWTFYDLFAMFFIIIAFYRLLGAGPAVITAISLVVFHGNSFLSWGLFIWLVLVVALLKVLPAGGLRKTVNLFGGFLWVGLTLYTIAFVTNEIRYLINPSLEARQYHQPVYNRAVAGTMPAAAPPAQMYKDNTGRRAAEAAMAMESLSNMAAAPARPAEEPKVANILQEKVNVSLGVPKWVGSTYSIITPGIIKADKELTFYYFGTGLVNLFKLIETINLVLIISWLTLILFDVKLNPKNWRKVRSDLVESAKAGYADWKVSREKSKEAGRVAREERLKRMQEKKNLKSNKGTKEARTSDLNSPPETEVDFPLTPPDADDETNKQEKK